MKKIFASFCLLAFMSLTFCLTPVYSREIIRETVTYNQGYGAGYTTTVVRETAPTP